MRDGGLSTTKKHKTQEKKELEKLVFKTRSIMDMFSAQSSQILFTPLPIFL